jgi:hypothetical protein
VNMKNLSNTKPEAHDQQCGSSGLRAGDIIPISRQGDEAFLWELYRYNEVISTAKDWGILTVLDPPIVGAQMLPKKPYLPLICRQLPGRNQGNSPHFHQTQLVLAD